MKKKTILLSLLGLLLAVGVGGVLALNFWLSRQLTRESIVRQLESQWNCRANLADLKVELYASPAHVEVKKLVLAKRDADAMAGTPLTQRKPLALGNGFVIVDDLLLDVDLTDLLHRRLHVKHLTLKGVNVQNSISSDDGNVLEILFRKPMDAPSPPPATAVAAAPEPAPTPLPSAPSASTPEPATLPTAPQPASMQEEHKPAKHPAFQADQLGMSVVIDEARLDGGTYREGNHIVDTKTEITDLHLAITQVDVDPGDLEHHNQCKAELSAHAASKGRAKINGSMQDVKIADFTFSTSGTVQPLDSATGLPSVTGAVELSLKKGSVLGGTLTLADVAGNDKGFKNVTKNLGVNLADVKAGGELQEDMNTQIVVKGSRLEFAKDARLLFPDYAATVHAGGWLNPEEDQMGIELVLMPSVPVAQRMISEAKAKNGDGVVNLITTMLNDDQGRLTFIMEMSGSLSKPRTEIGGSVGAIEKALRGVGGDFLKGLFK